MIVTTFKALAAIADFEAAPPAGSDETAESAAAPARRRAATVTRSDTEARSTALGAPTININIQLQLPATEDAAIYDKLFAALKKHLFS